MRRWQVVLACLTAGAAGASLVGWGALGAWQGLTDNRNSVGAETVTAVAVTSLHCSGGATPYAGCTDTSGTVSLSWAPVTGSPGLVVYRASSPGGPYTAIASLTGTATAYTDTTAAYNSQYYYQVLSEAAPGWLPGTQVDMALSLPPTGGTDHTAGTGGTPFSAASLASMATAGGAAYTTTNPWGGPNTDPLQNDQVNGLTCMSATMCWAVTQDGAIWATSDGGYTWSEQLPRGNQLYGIDCVSTSLCWVAGGNKENIDGTTDGGATWTSLHSHPGATFYAVEFADASHGWVVGSGGVIWASTDGGTAWAAQASGTGQQLNGIDCATTGACEVVGNGGIILGTTDGGASWAPQPSGTGQALAGISCVSAALCWTVGGAGTILMTADGGRTWTTQASGTTSDLKAVSMVSATTGWAVGAGGTILKTTDGGAVWAAQASGTIQSLNAVSAVSASTAMVGVTSGGGTGSVLMTTDGGATWTAPSSQYLQWTFSPTVAAGAPVTSAVVTLVDSASAVPSAGTMTTLLVSADSGGSWTPFRIANPSTALSVQTVSVLSVIGSAAAASSLELRYVISGSNAFRSTFDLVHVDIN
jgi:photosystem II stability/assembly factor-like uncharacterized protein